MFAKLDVAHCDDFLNTTNPVTFVNGLGHSSFIDHCFVSGSIRHHVSHIEIGDSGINLSDHISLIVSLHSPCKLSSTSRVDNVYALRKYSWHWDKTDKSAYYDRSGNFLCTW